MNRERAAVGMSTSEPGFHSPEVGLSGAALSRSARTKNFRSATTALGLRLYGITQSGVAPRLEAEEHVGCGTNVERALPDIPTGKWCWSSLAAKSLSAANVTPGRGTVGYWTPGRFRTSYSRRPVLGQVDPFGTQRPGGESLRRWRASWRP